MMFKMKQIKVKVSNQLLNKMDWKENLSEVYIFTLLCANYNLFSSIGLCQNEMTISLDRLLTNFEIKVDKKAKEDFIVALRGLIEKGIIEIDKDKISYTSEFTITDLSVFNPESNFTMIDIEGLVQMTKGTRPQAKQNVAVYLNIVSRTNNKLFHMTYENLIGTYTNTEYYGEDNMLTGLNKSQVNFLLKATTWENLENLCETRVIGDECRVSWINRKTLSITIKRLEDLGVLACRTTNLGKFHNSLTYFNPTHEKLIEKLYERKEKQTEYVLRKVG